MTFHHETLKSAFFRNSKGKIVQAFFIKLFFWILFSLTMKKKRRVPMLKFICHAFNVARMRPYNMMMMINMIIRDEFYPTRVIVPLLRPFAGFVTTSHAFLTTLSCLQGIITPQNRGLIRA